MMNSPCEQKEITYEEAGVSIQSADTFIERIKPWVKKTHNENVLANIGGFSAMYALPTGYQQPVLVSCTDGVGTKVKIASHLNQFQSIGQDLVAMCVNDLITCGAQPLFFLDYYAMSKLDVDTAETLIISIAQACQLASCALIGGETAEMPGHYQGNDFDLAGFCVGVVDQEKIIDGRHIKHGHSLIALGSNGLHANGFSLVRKIIEQRKLNYDCMVDHQTLAEHCLAPTRIYVNSIMSILKDHRIDGIAHITGGGLIENPPRMLPAYTKAIIDRTSWTLPPIFNWLKNNGPLSDHELLRTFNCGVGLLLCVPSNDAQNCIRALTVCGEQAWEIGHIVSTQDPQPRVEFN